MQDGDTPGKPRNTLCDKWCDGGCTIYEERPQVCADYMCLWLKINSITGNLPVELRPDNSKVVIIAKHEDGVGRLLMDETEPNSFDITNPTLAQGKLIEEVLKLMSNQTIPVELYVRSYDWEISRVNIEIEKTNNNNANELQQDKE